MNAVLGDGHSIAFEQFEGLLLELNVNCTLLYYFTEFVQISSF